VAGSPDLSGRRVLLTGASGGLGGAIARALHGRGAEVLAAGRRAEALEELRAELGDRVEPMRADLTSPDEVRSLAERAGRVDVLVAAAGLPGTGRVEGYAEDELDRALDVNLRAPMQLARALLPGMLERGSGHLVFVNSMSGKFPNEGAAVYGATKAGLRAFATAVREDLRGTGVGVSSVFPGFVSGAGMWAKTGLELPRGFSTSTPEDVARAVLRALDTGRAEIDVASPRARLAVRIATIAPALGAAMGRRVGGAALTERMAETQRDQR
jgi:short-subunit dehydrogenase